MAVATKSTRAQAEAGIQDVGFGSLAEGDIIGPYRVIRFLGRGGMGEVYEVLHTLLGKHFALKLISKELSQDEKARNLFRREGREAGNLDHPNIVRVDDCGEVDGRMYLRMELVEGRPCRGDTCVTLTDYIIACQLRVPPEEAIPILHDILRGLNYAHSCRRVHRDIKPSNILMTPKAAKIGDFGLVMSGARPGGDMSQMSEVVVMGLGAQSMMNATQATGASAAAGTPDYMAPELLSGSVEANYSTDVYSVGILLLEMLTGSRRVGAAKPSQLLRSYYKLEPWWDQLYERSTAYHEDRFANAGEMLGFFIEVSGVAKAKEVPEEKVLKSGSGPATTRISANWGNAVAPEPAIPREQDPPPAAKPTSVPPPRVPESVTPPAPAAKAAASPAPAADPRRIPIPPVPANAKRGLPWIPFGAGGAVVVIGVSLYLATRTTQKLNPTSPKEPPVETPRNPRPSGNGVTNAQVPRTIPSRPSPGPLPSTNRPPTRLEQEDAQLKREELAVSEALKNGLLEEAWNLVNKKGALVTKTRLESVKRARDARKAVEDALKSEDVGRVNQSLAAWQYAKPVEMTADPDSIRNAQKFVEKSISEGNLQLAWRANLQKAMDANDVPGIRSLLDTKLYQTDPMRTAGQKALKTAEDTSKRFEGQVRKALEDGDLEAARGALALLNKHLVDTKQQPNSQLLSEIDLVQRRIQEQKVAKDREQKVAKAIEDVRRSTLNREPPPTSSDPEVINSPQYQAELKLAKQRYEEWKASKQPQPIPQFPEPLPDPPVLPPPQEPVPIPNPNPPAGLADKGRFGEVKKFISELGKKDIKSATKREMMSFLQSYKQSHPEDAKEASQLIENLRNR